MKSSYPIIKASAAKHPYQWVVAKLGIKESTEKSFSFSVDMISVIFEIAHSFCDAFLQIIFTRPMEDRLESMSIPKSLAAYYSQIITSPAFAKTNTFCVQTQKDGIFQHLMS